jgi:HSP20 family molecular chaperone IbpA
MKRKSGRHLPPETTEESLQITVPGVTKRSLKIRAAETGVTMRAIVLSALAARGIEVPETELQGRRKD